MGLGHFRMNSATFPYNGMYGKSAPCTRASAKAAAWGSQLRHPAGQVRVGAPLFGGALLWVQSEPQAAAHLRALAQSVAHWFI